MKNIESFLKSNGFELIHCGNGCCEWIKEIEDDALYVYQINGEGISEITSINDPIIFSENGKDAFETPMYRYSKTYPNFPSMIECESKRCGLFKSI